MTVSTFYYPVVLNKNSGGPSIIDAPVVASLPSSQNIEELIAILSATNGVQPQGMYVFDGTKWRLILPVKIVSASIIEGSALSVYVNPISNQSVPMGSQVYKNGILTPTNMVLAGSGAYAVRTPPSAGGSAAGVASLNGKTGAVTLVGQLGLTVDSTGTDIAIKPGDLTEGTY